MPLWAEADCECGAGLKVSGKDIVIHHKAVANIIDDGLREGESIAAISLDGGLVLLVDIQDKAREPLFLGKIRRIIKHRLPQASAMVRREKVEFVEFRRVPRMIGGELQVADWGLSIVEQPESMPLLSLAPEYLGRIHHPHHVADLLRCENSLECFRPDSGSNRADDVQVRVASNQPEMEGGGNH